MKSLFFTLTALALLAGCNRSFEILSTDAGPDEGMPDMSSPDGAMCTGIGPTCLATREIGDVLCCLEDSLLEPVCDAGSWTCPPESVDAESCELLQPNCEPDEEDECATMDVRTRRDLTMLCAGISTTEYYWDGRACRPIQVGCGYTECEGADCDSLYRSRSECVGARLACPLVGQCQEMDAQAVADVACDPPVRWKWNGWACERFAECGCVGLDCEGLYESESVCEDSRKRCTDACDALDLEFSACTGPRDSGFIWNGFDCVYTPLVCTADQGCRGEDCNEVFTDQDACRARFSACIGPAKVTSSLTCELDEDELVDIALRIGACGGGANQIIGDYFMLSSAIPLDIDPISAGGRGGCRYLECAKDAASCSELEACLPTLSPGACGESALDECVGDRIYACDRGESLVPRGDCSPLGGVCEMVPTSGDREIATCEVAGNAAVESFGSAYCDGDDLVVNIDGSGVRLHCGTYFTGGVCRDVRFSGEIPGPACGYPEAECDEFLSSYVSCEGDEAILCVGGRTRRIDCIEEGYSACNEGTGCAP